jgi:myo-inositol-1(or 4)-monophosphatase
MSDIPGLIATASEAAREAGEFLATRFADARIVTEMRRDVKLSEDSEAEAIIVERLRRTGLPILAEESAEMTNALDLDLVWIVDPLDGSYNYNRGFDRCVVAIGLLAKGRPVGGVIFDFLRNDLLAGGPGFGAVCNGRPMRVSGVREAADAALVTGLPANRDFSGESMAGFSRQLARYKKVRMLGSAASSLALVARGIFDVYHEQDIMLWDVAAGAALVEAAGGAVLMQPSPRVPNAVHITAASDPGLLPG